MVDQKLLVEEAKKIIAQEDVKYVIGYKKGTYGFTISPSYAYTPEYAENFIYNPLCAKNLASYPILEEKLPLGREEKEDVRKIGIVAKGCDARSLIQVIQEKGLKRESVVIIGIPCTGVIDPKKIKKRFPNARGETDVVEEGDTYLITVNGETQKVPKDELLSEICRSCESPNPPMYDVLIGEEVEVPEMEEYKNLKELEEINISDKWEYWEKHFERCIRCYACREACPLCYCKECMVDLLDPQWVRRSVNVSENTAWNIMRAFHLAGRCVGCGECERACPVNIPLMELNKKLAKDVKELFEYTSGMDVEEKPLFGTFRPDDPEEFIL